MIPYKTGKYPRILALAPSTHGLGYAVIESFDSLVDWGVRQASSDKNKQSLKYAKELIEHYQPELMALEDTSAKTSRRVPRIKKLTAALINLAVKNDVAVALFTQSQIRSAFFADGKGTKHEIAAGIAAQYPEELLKRLPPKRKPWMPKDYRMDIFDAVALALTAKKQRKHRRKG